MKAIKIIIIILLFPLIVLYVVSKSVYDVAHDLWKIIIIILNKPLNKQIKNVLPKP